MGRRSHIRQLPEPIRSEVDRLLKAGATIDDVVAHLKELGTPVSRSSVGRYRQDFERIGARLREAREIAGGWIDQLGAEPESDVGRLLAEMLRTVAFRTIAEMGDAERAAPADIMLLAKSIKDMAAADKASADRELRIRKEFVQKAEAAAEQVDKALKAQGLSKEGAEMIRGMILGIGTA